MKKEYWLKKGMILIPVTIQEEAKEDFKELMGWSEEEFKEKTAIRFIRERKKEIIQYKTYFCNKCKKSIKFRFVKDIKTGWIKEITKLK